MAAPLAEAMSSTIPPTTSAPRHRQRDPNRVERLASIHKDARIGKDQVRIRGLLSSRPCTREAADSAQRQRSTASQKGPMESEDGFRLPSGIGAAITALVAF